MKRILGLDLGTNSIGWTVIEKNDDDGKIVDMGVRIFPEGVENLGDGQNEISKNASRRDARQIRRQGFRRKLRKRLLLKTLAEHHMCPISVDEATSYKAAEPLPISNELKTWFALNPYTLRAKGTEEKLTLIELGRVFYHIGQRRGFQTNSRNVTEDGKIFDGNPKEGKTGIEETRQALDGKTLGSYLNEQYPTENESYRDGLTRIRNRYTTRQMYIDEFEEIWETQSKFHSELTPELKELFGGRKREAEFSKDGILFFQRPLRSQKFLIGKCSFEPTKPKCPISAIEFELFRAHQFINTIEYNGRFLNNDQRELALELLLSMEAPNFKRLRKKLRLEGAGLKFNYKDDDKCPGTYTISKLSSKKFFGQEWLSKTEKEQQDIWHVLFSFDDKEKLKEYAATKWGFDAKQQEDISKFRLKQGYSNLSRKAIRNILPFLEQGYSYDVAVALGGIKNAFGTDWETLPDRDKQFILDNVPAIARSNMKGGYINELRSMLLDEFALTEKQLSKLYHHSTNIHAGELLDRLPVSAEADREIQKVRNPIVIQALFELRKVVNAIIDKYGKLDEIKVELARDLKVSKEARQKTRIEQKRLEAVNDYVKGELEKNGVAIKHENILKYKLWQECEHTCPFTGKQIRFEQLFNGSGEVQIEHILPWSKSLDDSFMNKTLCYADENRKKGNRTPYEYFTQDFGADKWEEVKNRTLKIFYDVHQKREKYFPNRYRKYKRFVATKYEEDFVSRQLNDTRYISREASNYLKRICKDVQVAPGQSTSSLRHHWGLNSILNESGVKMRDDHRHHAIDALTMACTDRWHLQQLSKINQYSHLNEIGSVDDPWPYFREDAAKWVSDILVSHKQNKKVITARKVKTKKNGKTFVNLGIAARDQLHKEFVFGKPKNGKEGVLHIRKPLESLQSKTHVSKIVDERIRKLIERRVEEMGGYTGSKKDKIPAGAFFNYEDGERIPLIKLPNRNGDDVPVYKVRMKETILNAAQIKGQNKYVNPRNNHHLLIYEDGDGELRYEPVSFWTAVERKKQGTPIIEIPDENGRLVDAFKKEDLFLLGIHPDELTGSSKSELSKYLFKVQKVSGGDYYFEICFRRHIDSRPDKEAKSDYVYIKNFGEGKTGWQTHRPIRVQLSAIGTLTTEND